MLLTKNIPRLKYKNMAETIISIRNANIYQGKRLILSNVNFQINKGEFVYLVGKTGTGKSSLLKTLYGELPLKEGDAFVVGHFLPKLTWKTVPFLRRDLGIVFQDFHLLTDRNVAENLRFVMKATGWKNTIKMNMKIKEVLEQVGLSHKENEMPFRMSGGEQQRLDIARALINSPQLILADEPTGNLDPATSDDIMQLLRKISQETNTSILMATHDFVMIEKYPSRILTTKDGKLHDSHALTL